MAQQNLTIGSSNAGGGDNYFQAATKIEANTTELYTNVATNAANIVNFTKTYWFYASDAGTVITPITHSAGATNTFLTNNALGGGTTSHNPETNAALWNSATNKFDFTSLKIGDVIEFRIDLLVDHAAAQEFNVLMSAAEGTAVPYEINVSHDYFKTAATGISLTVVFSLFIGNENTRTGSARLRIASAAAASIVVEGWFYKITEV